MPARNSRLLGATIALAVMLFVSQLVEIPWRSALRGSDNTYNYLWLRSWMVSGDWDFRDDLEACNTLTETYRAAALNAPPTDTGLLANKYGVGWSVVSLPFYLVADGLTGLARSLGASGLKRDGYNPVYQICLQIGHFLLAILSLLLVHRVMLRWCSPQAALPGLLFIWLCSPLLYYQTSNLSMSHGVTFFAVALLLWSLSRAIDDPARVRWWLLAGAATSLAAVTRFQTAIIGLIPIIVWLHQHRRLGQPWRCVVVCALGAAPLVVLQLYAWKTVYGRWLISSYGENNEGFDFANPALTQVLFSPYHGLFHWHPFLLAGLVGMFFFARRNPVPGCALLAVAALTIYINASWWCWWFGASFGQRAFDCALPGLMIGLGWLFQRASPTATTWIFRVGYVFALLNVFLLILYRTNLIPRNAPVTWLDAFSALF